MNCPIHPKEEVVVDKVTKEWKCPLLHGGKYDHTDSTCVCGEYGEPERPDPTKLKDHTNRDHEAKEAREAKDESVKTETGYEHNKYPPYVKQPHDTITR